MINKVVGMHGIPGRENMRNGLKWRFLLLLLGMVVLWTVLCGVSHRAPDLDGMEELVWASSFELGYYKHPPFPSWVLYALTSVVGKPVWLTFFAGQLFSALALWFVWLLGCEFTTPRRALIATLMVSVTIYFSLRGTIYNHNTAQLWSIAAATWLLYRALRYQKRSSWLWLGAVCALSTMTKYSALIQFAVFFCFMLRQGHLRQAATFKGIAYALAAYIAVLSPHLYWLAKHNFAPLLYADSSIAASGYWEVWQDMLDFTLDQLARLSPMVVVWLALLYWTRRDARQARKALAGGENAAMPRQGARNVLRFPGRASGPGSQAGGFSFSAVPESYAKDMSAWDRSFLLWIGLGPFVLTLLVSALLGTRLVASWASTFFMLYGYFALWWLFGNERVNLRRTLVLVVAVHVLMAVGYALARGPLAYYSGRTARSTFPGAIISTEMQKVWHEHVPQLPLGLVASDTWLGGNIAVHAEPHTQVFIDANYFESPWLNPATALDCGVLVVYSTTTRGEPAADLIKLYDKAQWRGVVDIPWSSAKSPAIEVTWGIVPPEPSCKIKP